MGGLLQAVGPTDSMVYTQIRGVAAAAAFIANGVCMWVLHGRNMRGQPYKARCGIARGDCGKGTAPR